VGLFWDLMQQSQISEHKERADSLEDQVMRLENELLRTRCLLHKVIVTLENEFGKDIDGDGRVG